MVGNIRSKATAKETAQEIDLIKRVSRNSPASESHVGAGISASSPDETLGTSETEREHNANNCNDEMSSIPRKIPRRTRGATYGSRDNCANSSPTYIKETLEGSETEVERRLGSGKKSPGILGLTRKKGNGKFLYRYLI